MSHLNKPKYEYANKCMAPILIACPEVLKPVAIRIMKLQDSGNISLL